MREAGAIRRAREKAATGRITKAVRDLVFARDNGRCCVCGLPVPREKMTIEHKIALANGGTNEPENLGPAHGRCNSSKGARVGPRRKGLRRSPLRAKPKSKIPEGMEVF